MRHLFEDSFHRLEVGEAPIVELMMAAYYRITRTEPLLRIAIARSETPEDKAFWQKAFDEEKGHADIFLNDMWALFSRTVANELVANYVPCKEVVNLLRKASEDIHLLAVYRAYLEYGLMCTSEPAKAQWRRLLPNMMKIHETADVWHSEETLRYLEDINDLQTTALHIFSVEYALTKELAHKGLETAHV